jgi:hypothetical protein
MAQFRVVLDGVELSKEDEAHLDRAIQKTVLGFLAGSDKRGDRRRDQGLLILNPELYGIWIRQMIEGLNLDLQSRAEELNKELQELGTPRF